MEYNKNEMGKITYPLDISSFYGDGNSRVLPTILFFVISAIPILLYMAFVDIISLYVFLVVEVITVVFAALLTFGDWAARKQAYVKQLYNMYTAVEDFMDSKEVNENGFINYPGNRIAYALHLKNRGADDPLQRAYAAEQLLKKLGTYIFDVRTYNIPNDDLLYSRYDAIKLFKEEQAANEFISIIDFNRDYVKENTLVMETFIIVYGALYEHATLKEHLKSVAKSDAAKAFKEVKLLEKEDFDRLLGLDFDTQVNIDDIQSERYARKMYYGSKVVGYDIEETELEIDDSEERGFMQ